MNMEKFIPDGYVLKEIDYQNEQDAIDDEINRLNKILLDRSIPEKSKQLVKKQFDELMKLKQATMKPPRIILEKVQDK